MWALISITCFVAWILQAALAGAIQASYYFGHFKSFKQNWRDEFGCMFLVALILPIFGLVLSYCVTGFARHGVRFWRLIDN